MDVTVTAITNDNDLHAFEPAWRAFAETVSNTLFRSPRWLMRWWRAYGQTLGATPFVLVVKQGEELLAVTPLYRRVTRFAVWDMAELRLFGDAGPRPGVLDSLCLPGAEEKAGAALAKFLTDEKAQWDTIELEPLADPSRLRANFVTRMVAAGFAVESAPAAGGIQRIALTGMETPPSEAITRIPTDAANVKKGLSALRRLSRLEWAEREEVSPLADADAGQLLEDIAVDLANQQGTHLWRLEDATGEAVASMLVVDDGERAVALALAIDPMIDASNAAAKLIMAQCADAHSRGKRALDVVGGAVDVVLPTLPVSRHNAIALRIWSQSATAQVGRTYRSVQRRARRTLTSPGHAAAQARSAWSRIRLAAANVAAVERYALYRGQVWTTGKAAPPDLRFSVMLQMDFDALSETERADFLAGFELDEARARADWNRGDFAAVAYIGQRPAGIAWCARGAVKLAELDRELSLGRHEALVHHVFVATSARGRGVAPALLEYVSNDLRQRDVYRSWALIAHGNQPSLRAFTKASYTPVCDVIYARMASVDKVVARPPDPEAKALLGLG